MKYIFSMLLILISIGMHAQRMISFTGVVTDSTSAPVELSNVIAIDKETDSITSFGITDYLGRFVLKLIEGKQYLISNLTKGNAT